MKNGILRDMVEIARKEATRDPIFLLQTRKVIRTNQDKYYWDSDAECLKDVYNDEPVTDEALIENGDAESCWHTEYVFLTREEKRSGEVAAEYVYGRKGKDWRVYCVCAEGELAKALKAIGAMCEALERLAPSEGFINDSMPDNEAVSLVTTVGALRQLAAIAKAEGRAAL